MQDSVAMDTFPALELGMQELEAMEAPGWWTAVGVSAGVVVASAVGYGSYVASAAVIAT
ncbi:daptide-type RiPP [Streptomyces sp. NPDC018693]|uniref:daptide-type RiPP n=1 Tax=unclassified Streptomyces TaxID=2593676 RepID=UPI00378F3EAD